MVSVGKHLSKIRMFDMRTVKITCVIRANEHGNRGQVAALCGTVNGVPHRVDRSSLMQRINEGERYYVDNGRFCTWLVVKVSNNGEYRLELAIDDGEDVELATLPDCHE